MSNIANRRAVLEALRAASDHPTAAEIYDRLRTSHPRLGRATVYRALASLEAAGLVVEVWRDTYGRHYDARVERHDHAVCVGCGRAVDVERPPAALPAAYQAAADASGYTLASYEVRYYGRCPACRQNAAGDPPRN
jgi:Fur family ferric uptake transcriptional regulator/Fur family peroxide stress response transcriptional regulator